MANFKPRERRITPINLEPVPIPYNLTPAQEAAILLSLGITLTPPAQWP